MFKTCPEYKVTDYKHQEIKKNTQYWPSILGELQYFVFKNPI